MRMKESTGNVYEAEDRCAEKYSAERKSYVLLSNPDVCVAVDFRLYCLRPLEHFPLVGAMLDIFRGLKSFIKVSHVQTDSTVFRIHYSVTVLILIAFSLLVTTRQYVGNPINCIGSKDIPEDVLNTFCWIHTTYHVPSAFNLKVGKMPGDLGEVVYPGINKPKGPGDVKYIKYYQWVCFCLFFQVSAMTFYVELGRSTYRNCHLSMIHT